MVITTSVIDQINYQTNRDMTYVSQRTGDRFIHGATLEHFRRGDCDDYCVLKAHRLKKAGVHPADMVMGCIATGMADKPNHAVLLVKGQRRRGILWWKRTEPCEWVLDSRHNGLYATDEIRETIDARIDIGDWI